MAKLGAKLEAKLEAKLGAKLGATVTWRLDYIYRVGSWRQSWVFRNSRGGLTICNPLT